MLKVEAEGRNVLTSEGVSPSVLTRVGEAEACCRQARWGVRRFAPARQAL
jgi:hypothetical protein